MGRDSTRTLNGGAGRNRTDDRGVAVHCITTLLPRLYSVIQLFQISFNYVTPFTEAYGYSCSEAAILGNVDNKSTTYQLLHSIAAKPA